MTAASPVGSTVGCLPPSLKTSIGTFPIHSPISSCRLCNEEVRQTSRHIAEVHLLISLHQCPLCEYGAAESRLVRRHMKNNHKKKDLKVRPFPAASRRVSSLLQMSLSDGRNSRRCMTNASPADRSVCRISPFRTRVDVPSVGSAGRPSPARSGSPTSSSDTSTSPSSSGPRGGKRLQVFGLWLQFDARQGSSGCPRGRPASEGPRDFAATEFQKGNRRIGQCLLHGLELQGGRPSEGLLVDFYFPPFLCSLF